MTRQVTFTTWKKAVQPCLRNAYTNNHDRAKSIVLEAAYSLSRGELNQRGYDAAERWAFRVDWLGALNGKHEVAKKAAKAG